MLSSIGYVMPDLMVHTVRKIFPPLLSSLIQYVTRETAAERDNASRCQPETSKTDESLELHLCLESVWYAISASTWELIIQALFAS